MRVAIVLTARLFTDLGRPVTLKGVCEMRVIILAWVRLSDPTHTSTGRLQIELSIRLSIATSEFTFCNTARTCMDVQCMTLYRISAIYHK